MPKTFRIGTRGSLLALTQSQQIKDQLESLSNHKFELVKISTQGDQQTEKPLWQLDGKDFFTKELDEALLKKEVDLVVHSYKDLGSQRPKGIKLAAITERNYPHDILLIKKETIKNLNNNENSRPFIVGTSSPRRIYNIKNKLNEFLPFKNINIETQTLRGNVNTRIEKLKTQNYDAIVLAMAGLERLAITESSRTILSTLLEDLDFMVMPTSVFPSAASQGALGIECLDNRDDKENKDELESLIGKLNHEITIREVNLERRAFKEYGGGCHLAIGINARHVRGSLLVTHRGLLTDNDKKTTEHVEIDEFFPPIRVPANIETLFIGLPEFKLNKYKSDSLKIIADKLTLKKPAQNDTQIADDCDLLYTSTYCQEFLTRVQDYASLWTAGTTSMKSLVANGYWVNGCLDSLGEEEANKLKDSVLLSLFKTNLKEKWKVLTHADSVSNIGENIIAYKRSLESPTEDYTKTIEKCDHFFWTSFTQFENYRSVFQDLEYKNHYCGMGSTYEQFTKAKVRAIPFKNISHLLEILKLHRE